MVDTIKFSQMTSGGDLANNETTPGLQSGNNVLFNNPWVFLAPGTTAQRPAPSSTINFRLRFNTDDQLYEYYDAVLGAWTQLQESSFTVGPFVTYTADSNLPDAQNLGALANGILKQTITSGSATLNIAVNGTDYYGPGFVVRSVDGGTGVNNAGLTINLSSATVGYVLTSDSSGNATWQPVSASGGITTIDGNSGTATPSAGVVTITGGSTGLTFTGSSHTLSLAGLLNPTFGGLGVSNPTAHGILVGEGSSAINPIVLGAGQILIGTTSGDPAAAAISSGTNILVGNSSGSITIGITGIIGISNGGTGVASVTTSPTATAWAGWDANKNLSANSFLNGYTTTVTAAATTTLTVSSTYAQFFTGSTTQTVLMPVTSTLVVGQSFYLVNNSSGSVTVQSSGGNTIVVMSPGTTLYLTCILTSGTTAASWYADYVINTPLTLPLALASGGTGAVLAASNGGIFYSNATTGAILAGTVTANQVLLSGSSSAPAWSTATYPVTTTINQLLYSSANNTITGLATANSSVLITSSGGVPSFSTTLPSGLSATNMNLTTPTLGVASATSINFGQTALSFYSEGTWTPVDASGASLTFTSPSGTYTRVGRFVIAFGVYTYPSTVNASANLVGGLPYTANSNIAAVGGGISYTTSTAIFAAANSNSTQFSVYGAAGASLTNASLSTKVLFVQICYFV